MAAVELRLMPLTGDEGGAMRLLDAQEQARAARFRFAEHRRRFVLRRAALRRVLGAATGSAPERLRFTTGAQGKPALADGALHFSSSHSADLALIALSEREVGVDLEAEDAALDWRPLAHRFFAATEVEELERLPEAAARTGFFTCWTRKEAFVKALGLGLSRPLDSFAVSLGEPALLLSGGTGWQLASVAAAPGFAAALVVPAGARVALRWS